ncbi:tRNA guanosine(34) transglycosylase Tgt [Nanoarchaeota archaeon]
MFKILNQEGKARLGELTTKRGKTIKTPFFMPVCTKGTVKMLSSKDLVKTKTKAVISNAFILSLRPGLNIIQNHGGYHKMIDFEGVIFTDSGGFQMLQPNFLLGVSKRGIHFRNPFDMKKMVVTPEQIAEISEGINADVAMILDDVVHYGNDEERMKLAVERTHLWTQRFLRVHSRETQLVFGINQGGTFPELRKKSSELLATLDVDGYALGGLCIGEGQEKMNEMVNISTSILPENKPRYLMGVGSPIDILHCISLGIDIFDSRFPTMNARHGRLFTRNGFIDINKGKHKEDLSPIDPNCDCYVCKTYTRSFIRHLIKADERTAHHYESFHNIYFVQQMLEEIHEALRNNRFNSYKEEFEKRWKSK